MFCLYTSSKFSRPQFEFSLKVKVNNGIESRLPFKIFSTLFKIFLHYIYHDNPPSQYSPLTGILLTKNNYCQISRYLPIAIFCGAFQTYPGLCRSCMNTSLFIGLIKNFKSRKKNLLLYTYYKKKKLLSIEIKPLSEGTHTVDNFDLYKLD